MSIPDDVSQGPRVVRILSPSLTSFPPRSSLLSALRPSTLASVCPSNKPESQSLATLPAGLLAPHPPCPAGRLPGMRGALLGPLNQTDT